MIQSPSGSSGSGCGRLADETFDVVEEAGGGLVGLGDALEGLAVFQGQVGSSEDGVVGLADGRGGEGEAVVD